MVLLRDLSVNEPIKHKTEARTDFVRACLVERRSIMFIINPVEYITQLDFMLYIFGAFVFYMVCLGIHKMIRG